jgi:predicted dehydrogenase
MAKAQKQADLPMTVGFTLRYSPFYRTLKSLLTGGRIGRIVSMEFNETLDFNHGGYIHGDWRRLRQNAGTHLLEKCCHDVDLVNWMVDSRAARVASFGGTNFFTPENVHHQERIGTHPENGKPAFQSWPHRDNDPPNPFLADKDIVDNQVAIVQYENGVRASFHTNCMAAIPERRMYICGSEGTIRADVITGTIELARVGWQQERESIDPGASGGHGGGDGVLAAEVAASILHGTPPTSTLTDGLRSAVTCFGIDQAHDEGRVVDMADYWRQVDAVMG